MFKLFRSFALIVGVVVIMGGCGSPLPTGTRLMAGVGKIATADEIKSTNNGHLYQMALNAGYPAGEISEGSYVGVTPFRDIFPEKGKFFAYVPLPLRGTIEMGDIVEVVASEYNGGKPNTVIRIARKNGDMGEGVCRWTGFILTSQTVECDFFEKGGWEKRGQVWFKYPVKK